jgi:hypothetical protein
LSNKLFKCLIFEQNYLCRISFFSCFQILYLAFPSFFHSLFTTSHRPGKNTQNKPRKIDFRIFLSQQQFSSLKEAFTLHSLNQSILLPRYVSTYFKGGYYWQRVRYKILVSSRPADTYIWVHTYCCLWHNSGGYCFVLLDDRPKITEVFWIWKRFF